VHGSSKAKQSQPTTASTSQSTLSTVVAVVTVIVVVVVVVVVWCPSVNWNCAWQLSSVQQRPFVACAETAISAVDVVA
jgi:hypothetical protein